MPVRPMARPKLREKNTAFIKIGLRYCFLGGQC
jgi:hypothetical protein